MYNTSMMTRFEGKISCKAILENPKREIQQVWIDKKKRDRDTQYILRLCKNRGCKVTFLERSKLDEMASSHTHGGILIDANPLSSVYFSEIQDPHGYFVYIDGIEDPYNLGSAARTLYAAGCNGLILPDRDWSSAEATIIKASAGAFEKLDIFRIKEDNELVETLDQHHIPLYAAHRKDAMSLYDFSFPDTFCLAIGGALRGLNANITSHSSQNIMIEYGRDFRNALDTPSACAVFGFEILRQKRQ